MDPKKVLTITIANQDPSVSLSPTLQKPVLMNVLNEASALKNILIMTVTDHFELCLAKCRTRDPIYQVVSVL